MFFFIMNRKIILIFDNQKSEILQISVKILQDSLLFLIFFLFYNVKLLEICNLIRKKINNIKFINDVNMLAYERFTKNNCKQLKRIHKKCLIMIKKYKILFASKKTEIINDFLKIIRELMMKMII